MTLLDALGAAKEGAWDLTADVYEHLGYRVKRSLVGRDGGRTWAFLNPSSSRWEAMQHFTASIDAALQLVPEGWIWDVTSTGQAWAMPDQSAGERTGAMDQVIAKAATPALALTMVALRARAAHGSTEEK